LPHIRCIQRNAEIPGYIGPHRATSEHILTHYICWAIMQAGRGCAVITGGIAMKRLAILIVSLCSLLLYGSTTTAMAAAGTRPVAATHGQDCVAQAEPAGSTVTPTATCYSSFSAAIRAATGGKVRLPARAKPRSVTSRMIDAWNADASGTFVLSVDYKDAD